MLFEIEKIKPGRIIPNATKYSEDKLWGGTILIGNKELLLPVSWDTKKECKEYILEVVKSFS